MKSAVVAVVAVALSCALAGAARAEPLTKVFINGRATPVSFNDGDSFRPHAGPYKGSQSRLAGYNTLESFGPVHSWGTWTEKEMWVNAKLATKHAQHGVWHCETDGKKDGYGRLLMHCKDLAKSLIENGFAMAMTIDELPADAELIEAQAVAIGSKRGMWAHGVPSYVLSSLHATSEGGGKDGKTYNRLVSTIDGHSEKWLHDDDYAECKKVCRQRKQLADAAFPVVSERLRAIDGGAELRDIDITRYADEYLSFGGATSARGALRAKLDETFKTLESEKALQATTTSDSCHVYVDFRRRFGGDRAVCLR
jgi:endonuclease YncB( thermonuclease family)